MKKLLVLILVMFSLILASCQQVVESEEESMAYNQAVSEVANVLGVELTEGAEMVLLAIIDNTPDFIWWAELNGYTPLSAYPSEDVFNLFLAWNGMPEELKRPPKEEEPVEPEDPYYWDNPPAVIMSSGYWDEWNLDYDYFIHHTNYVYIFVKQDGTSGFSGSHPNKADWSEDGIPIPVDKTQFNSWITEAWQWAIDYYLEHFTGENADYKLPPIPEVGE